MCIDLKFFVFLSEYCKKLKTELTSKVDLERLLVDARNAITRKKFNRANPKNKFKKVRSFVLEKNFLLIRILLVTLRLKAKKG